MCCSGGSCIICIAAREFSFQLRCSVCCWLWYLPVQDWWSCTPYWSWRIPYGVRRRRRGGKLIFMGCALEATERLHRHTTSTPARLLVTWVSGITARYRRFWRTRFAFLRHTAAWWRYIQSSLGHQLKAWLQIVVTRPISKGVDTALHGSKKQAYSRVVGECLARHRESHIEIVAIPYLVMSRRQGENWGELQVYPCSPEYCRHMM